MMKFAYVSKPTHPHKITVRDCHDHGSSAVIITSDDNTITITRREAARLAKFLLQEYGEYFSHFHNRISQSDFEGGVVFTDDIPGVVAGTIIPYENVVDGVLYHGEAPYDIESLSACGSIKFTKVHNGDEG